MKPKILIVDDEELFLMSMQELLQNHFDVSIAESAIEALQLIKNSSEFAVIITDIHMPEMDGIQLLEETTILSPRTVRIVLTSDFTQQATQNAVNSANIFAYLKKPCPIANFAKTIRNAIKQYNSIKQQNIESLQTLIDIIQVYNCRLAKINPDMFKYCDSISNITQQFLKKLKLSKVLTKEINLTLHLLPLVFLDLSQELCEYILVGGKLSEKHSEEFFKSIHKISMEALPNSTELQSTTRSLLFITKGMNGTGYPTNVTCISQIPVPSRILKLVMDFKQLQLQGSPPSLTLLKLEQSGLYDPRFLNDFDEVIKQDKNWKELEVSSDKLVVNMVLKEAIHTPDGGILVARNERISLDQINRIQNFDKNSTQSIKVYFQEEF